MSEKLTGGLDEVGWGSPAGPIISAVVVLKPSDYALLPSGITDSKKMTEKKRDAIFLQLLAAVTDKGIGTVEPWEIDEMSPRRALQESYRRAIAELKTKPDILIVDGTDGTNRVDSYIGEQLVEPKADFNHKPVAIASIIAKVVRDTVMRERHAVLKKMGLDYNWAKNKGYLTADHKAAIEKHGLLFGPSRVLYQHRRSYCSDMLGKVKIYGR